MPAPASAYLQIERLSKQFGSFAALKEVSLQIERGELVCFLGPSGCGKTTLLRIIAGLEKQSAGRIVQDGRDVSGLPPTERDFGIVFQSYALFPNLTVKENVGYGLRSLRRPRAEVAARVGELLALVGISDQGDKYPAQLSGGQQQRVALARALAMSPSLLLLDEPLSALDARVRVNLRHEIKALQRRVGVTTVMVTHDQEEALVLADRIVVMNHGTIEQIGTPTEIYRRPASVFVADFVGQMNFLPATAEMGGRVRLGPVILNAEGGAEAAAGSRVLACIRPEDVAIGAPGTEAANSLPATVQEVTFLGSVLRLALHSGVGDTILLNAELPLKLAEELAIAPGSTVAATLPPGRIRVYADSSTPVPGAEGA